MTRAGRRDPQGTASDLRDDRQLPCCTGSDLRLRYREHAAGPVSTTIFDLYQLARLRASGPSSAIPRPTAASGFTGCRGSKRSRTTGDEYAIPPRFRLEKFLRGCNHRTSDHLKEVRLRFIAEVAALDSRYAREERTGDANLRPTARSSWS